jgi:hypothetical protein
MAKNSKKKAANRVERRAAGTMIRPGTAPPESGDVAGAEMPRDWHRLSDPAAFAPALGKTLDDAWREFTTAVNTARAGDGDLTADELRNIHELLAEVGRAQGQTTDLSMFFRSVGEGVLDAQRQLDQASVSYSLGEPAHATAYRIPKVSAQINFAITSVTAGGFNVFVAKRESELKSAQQQRVSFDIVAAPAPAQLREELARRFAALVAGLAANLAMAPAARTERLRLLEAATLPPAVRAQAAAFKAAADRLILFEIDGGKQFAFVRVVPDASPAWDAIVIAEPGAGKPSRYLGVAGPDARERDVLLGDLLARLADVTREYVKPPPPAPQAAAQPEGSS